MLKNAVSVHHDFARFSKSAFRIIGVAKIKHSAFSAAETLASFGHSESVIEQIVPRRFTMLAGHPISNRTGCVECGESRLVPHGVPRVVVILM